MYNIRFVNSTACLILEDETIKNDYIDYQFINKFHYENFMTFEELKNEAEELAVKNNVTEFNFDYSQFKQMEV